jgi:hypothetical protein
MIKKVMKIICPERIDEWPVSNTEKQLFVQLFTIIISFASIIISLIVLFIC